MLLEILVIPEIQRGRSAARGRSVEVAVTLRVGERQELLQFLVGLECRAAHRRAAAVFLLGAGAGLTLIIITAARRSRQRRADNNAP